MQRYANRRLNYYEAPAVSHGYRTIEIPYKLMWHNLIEPGMLNKRSVHNSSRDCLCFVVGPYFHYVDPFYDDEEFFSYKKRIGRNLTVFPVHSVAAGNVEYDTEEFVGAVLEEAKNYDSITVCAYYTNHNSKTVELFKANGAKIVSAGYSSDTSFVKRLKTIILLADAVVTNGLGSHINHALSVDRPVKIISQHIRMFTPYENSVLRNVHNSKLIQQTVLETDGYHITREILDAYEPATGFTQTKTKEELGAIFDLSKRIIQNCGYLRSKQIDGIRQAYRDLQFASSHEEKLQFRLMREALPIDYDDYIRKQR